MLFLLALISSADAYIYIGNPSITLSIERDGDLTGGSVDVDFVRIHRCDGTYVDYDGGTFDPTVGWSKKIDGGDLCTAEVVWDDVGEVWSSSFHLKSNVTATPVKLTGVTQVEPWSPFAVVSGPFSGPGPVVHVEIQ